MYILNRNTTDILNIDNISKVRYNIEWNIITCAESRVYRVVAFKENKTRSSSILSIFIHVNKRDRK